MSRRGPGRNRSQCGAAGGPFPREKFLDCRARGHSWDRRKTTFEMWDWGVNVGQVYYGCLAFPFAHLGSPSIDFWISQRRSNSGGWSFYPHIHPRLWLHYTSVPLWPIRSTFNASCNISSVLTSFPVKSLRDQGLLWDVYTQTQLTQTWMARSMRWPFIALRRSLVIKERKW